MKHVQLTLHMTDELALKSVSIDFNSTHFPNDSKLVKLACLTLLKSLHLNKDSVLVQDLLYELGIETQKD